MQYPVHLESLGYYSELTKLIEQMYKDGGNKKVTIVAPSMGGPVTLYFLNNVVDQGWKDKYIHAFVPLAGAWSGGSRAVQALISGLPTGDELTRHLLVRNFLSLWTLLTQVRDVARTLPSVFYMLPNPTVWKDKVIVYTPESSYTANDYEKLFADMGYPVGFTKYSSGIADINEDYPAPKVPVYCFYGTGIPTPETFYYSNGFDKIPKVTKGDGDGSVNLLSLEVCLKWKSEQRQYFKSQTFPGVNHAEIVKDVTVLDAVKEIVHSI